MLQTCAGLLRDAEDLLGGKAVVLHLREDIVQVTGPSLYVKLPAVGARTVAGHHIGVGAGPQHSLLI